MGKQIISDLFINNKSKRILYVGGFELPDKNAAAQRVLAVSKLMGELHYETFFIGVDKSKGFVEGKIIRCIDYDCEYLSKPQRYPQSQGQWLKFISDASFVINTIENALKKNVILIIAYNYPAIPLRKLTKYAHRNGIKIISDVTEWYEPHGSILFRFMKGLDSFLRMRIFHKKLDGQISISKYLNNFYISNNSILIPPLVDKQAMKWKLNSILSSKNILKLVYIGSPGGGQKDRLDKIIKALSLVKDRVRPFKFSIIGINQEQYLESFVDKNLPNNLSENIAFLGRISHLEALDELKDSDFSIFLRDINLVNTAGFPTKFVESVTCGVPVLTNDSSNIKLYLNEGNLGKILYHKNEKDLEPSLIEVLNFNNDQIELMKTSCRDYNKFDFRYYKSKMEKFLDNLAYED